MSSILQFKKIAKHANLRAVLLCVMGAVSLLFTSFLESSMVYVIAAYAILNSVLGVWDFISKRGSEEKGIAYFNLIVAGITMVCGILCFAYARYLLKMLPIFFGALLMIAGIVYFVAAVCAKTGLKPLLILLSLIIGIGGFVLMVFTFGFGGLLTLSRMFGVLLLICCTDELLMYLAYKKGNSDLKGDSK